MLVSVGVIVGVDSGVVDGVAVVDSSDVVVDMVDVAVVDSDVVVEVVVSAASTPMTTVPEAVPLAGVVDVKVVDPAGTVVVDVTYANLTSVLQSTQPSALNKTALSHSASPWSQMAKTTVKAPLTGTPTRKGGDEPGYEVTLFGGVMTKG